MTKKLRVVVFALLFGSLMQPALAQTTPDDCNRSWLGADWPSVVTDCQTLAESSDAEGNRSRDEANYAPPGTPAQQIDASKKSAQAGYLVGAMAHARAAIGYLKLKRKTLYATQRQKALQDLTSKTAMLGSDSSVNSRAASLKSFIESSSFPVKAADSDLLAHI